MRLLENERGHEADSKIESISYSRLVADNMFDALVLLGKA
jgi:hypothetical protein